MNTSSRFAVAIHVLTLLALNHDQLVTSERIAGSVNTNPVVIRRLLGALREARLVTSQGGNGGGWRLVGDPEAITLRDVYRAVEDSALFSLHHQPPNPACTVGRHIQQALNGRFADAMHAMEDELAQSTIAGVLREVLAPAG
ncbi:MAG TPA: Rrf2 family transcriptional regulator [Chloroflexota bacterium]|nr:Rrf2 family transcriptional regulator [Chloroflexota bacterium]